MPVKDIYDSSERGGFPAPGEAPHPLRFQVTLALRRLENLLGRRLDQGAGSVSSQVVTGLPVLERGARE